MFLNRHLTPLKNVCRCATQWTLWFPHKKGFDYIEPDIPISDRMKMGFKAWPAEWKKLKEEWINKSQLDEPGHGDVKIEWKFENKAAVDDFIVTCDRHWQRGNSEGDFLLSENKTGLFSGHLDPTVPKDGTTTRAGVANITSKPKMKSFMRNGAYLDWNKFTHLAVKVRGDGRTYLLVISTPGAFDVTWHDTFCFPLFTHGGPYWQYELIPFSKFYLASHGRIQDKQLPVECFRPARVGITLCDRIDGDFSLELDWIGVYNDKTHTERFAYELYRTPYLSA